ncbi:MAG: hypothetical protein KBS82_05160 [Oscillospiraceae bacterium]|nr:hypothetical protein [Candidatus Limimonas egerieequi]
MDWIYGGKVEVKDIARPLPFFTEPITPEHVDSYYGVEFVRLVPYTTGHWIECNNSGDYMCSACFHKIKSNPQTIGEDFAFCPHCGAANKTI